MATDLAKAGPSVEHAATSSPRIPSQNNSNIPVTPVIPGDRTTNSPWCPEHLISALAVTRHRATIGSPSQTFA
jgi:hypothetical protein